MAGQQHPACPVGGQQLIPGNGPRPGCMHSGTRRGKPCGPGGRASSPGYSALAASLALMVPAPACSQRAEVPPGEQPAVRGSDIYARGGVLTGAILALQAIAVEHSLLVW